MDSSPYLIGRELTKFTTSKKTSDRIFANERLDEEDISEYDIAHSTFANMSFLRAKLSRCRFVDCVFIDCYFRRAEFDESQFIGCKFIACDFPFVSVNGCDFRYAKFVDCFIGFSEVSLSLPREPNIRKGLCRSLATEAAKLGSYREARAFRMCEIKAHEDDLWLATKGANDWYRRHYDSLGRIGALLKLIVSISNRYLWGYGERARTLLLNYALATFVIFPLILYLLKSGLQRADKSQVSYADCVYLSLQNMLPTVPTQSVQFVSAGAKLMSLFESFVGIVIAGLLVSYLFRWIIRR